MLMGRGRHRVGMRGGRNGCEGGRRRCRRMRTRRQVVVLLLVLRPTIPGRVARGGRGRCCRSRCSGLRLGRHLGRRMGGGSGGGHRRILPCYNSTFALVVGIILRAPAPMASLRALLRAQRIFVRHLGGRTGPGPSDGDAGGGQDGWQRRRLKAASSSSSARRKQFVVLEELGLVQRRVLGQQDREQLEVGVAGLRRESGRSCRERHGRCRCTGGG